MANGFGLPRLRLFLSAFAPGYWEVVQAPPDRSCGPERFTLLIGVSPYCLARNRPEGQKVSKSTGPATSTGASARYRGRRCSKYPARQSVLDRHQINPLYEPLASCAELLLGMAGH
jgi:hypothetical protein